MIAIKRIRFRCKNNEGTEDIVLEDYELDFYIYATIQHIEKTTTRPAIVVMNTQILNFIQSTDFHINITLDDETDNIRYRIYGRRILLSDDCLLQIFPDMLGDIINGNAEIKI